MTSEYKIYPLGYKSYTLSVSQYKNEPTIHIRKREGGKFHKDGIALSPIEWTDLTQLHAEVTRLIPTVVANPGTTRYWEIGGRGRRMTLKNYRGGAYVDIRNYWAPPGHSLPLPTKIGVILSSDAFVMFNDLAIFIEDDINQMRDAITEQAEWSRVVNERLRERRRLLQGAQAEAMPDLPPGEIIRILEAARPEPAPVSVPQASTSNPQPPSEPLPSTSRGPLPSLSTPDTAGPQDADIQQAQEVPPLMGYYEDASASDEDEENDVEIYKVDPPLAASPPKRKSSTGTTGPKLKKTKRRL